MDITEEVSLPVDVSDDTDEDAYVSILYSICMYDKVYITTLPCSQNLAYQKIHSTIPSFDPYLEKYLDNKISCQNN